MIFSVFVSIKEIVANRRLLQRDEICFGRGRRFVLDVRVIGYGAMDLLQRFLKDGLLKGFDYFIRMDEIPVSRRFQNML